VCVASFLFQFALSNDCDWYSSVCACVCVPLHILCMFVYVPAQTFQLLRMLNLHC